MKMPGGHDGTGVQGSRKKGKGGRGGPWWREGSVEERGGRGASNGAGRNKWTPCGLLPTGTAGLFWRLDSPRSSTGRLRESMSYKEVEAAGAGWATAMGGGAARVGAGAAAAAGEPAATDAGWAATAGTAAAGSSAGATLGEGACSLISCKQECCKKKAGRQSFSGRRKPLPCQARLATVLPSPAQDMLLRGFYSF